MIYLTKIPIFRRLFLAFFLADLLLNSIIVGISTLYIGVLQSHGVSAHETNLFVFWTIIAMIAVTVGLIGLGYLLNMTITQPLTSLAMLARHIREGQTNARASVLGQDEIAIVADSINHMLDRMELLIYETRAQRDVLQDEAERLIAQVSKVGEGDLTIQATVGSESIAVLADFFNYIIEELSSLVGRVRHVALGVERSTLSTQQEMFRLVNIADQQLSSIQEIASTIKNMAKAFQLVVERTKHLNQATNRARQAAQQGRGVAQQILLGIEQIGQKTQESARLIKLLEGRSQEVGEVVTLLDSLAHQTNKLALDAAIQVAMNGTAETNQGFGAIADEIRRISERTKTGLTAVSRNMQGIRTDIETVSIAVGDAAHEAAAGILHIQQTRQFFATIFDLVEQQAQESDTITTMIDQLYSSTFHIGETMQVVSQNTLQSSERTRQIAHEMRQLAALAQQLHLSVEVFKLKPSATEISQGERKELLGI